MENFQYSLPTRYIFGQGVSSKVGQTISSLGYKKVLIVYGGDRLFALVLSHQLKINWHHFLLVTPC